jgi:perosamine synthetase
LLPDVLQMCASETSTIEQTLRTIDANAQGICFIVNENQAFVGVVTDGDIRRGLLKGISLSSSVQKIVNTNAFSLSIDTPAELIQSSLNEKIKHIPLLDEYKKIVDYACFHRLYRIPVMEPSLGGNELAYVTDCVKSGWISSKGTYVLRFEEQIGKICQTPYAVAVSNGTTALHLALAALGIGQGDEVIVPNFTFAASINAVLYTGATPVLIDIEPDTWNISISQLEKAITPKTKAIMPVHIYGHPCDMDSIMALAEKNKLLVVEDCAEALGSTYKGRPVGTFGDAATFSFYGNKVITTGEGGMVTFKNQNDYERGKMMRDHGMSPTRRYWHDLIGYNYRMTNLQAAIGVAQMEQFEMFLSKRQEIAKSYSRLFEGLAGIHPQPLKKDVTSCHWLYTILLSENLKIKRDSLIEKLLMNGIETRPTFYPLHEMPIYNNYAGNRDFSVSTFVSKRGLSLPSSVHITEKEIQNIVGTIKQLVEIGEIK